MWKDFFFFNFAALGIVVLDILPESVTQKKGDHIALSV